MNLLTPHWEYPATVWWRTLPRTTRTHHELQRGPCSHPARTMLARMETKQQKGNIMSTIKDFKNAPIGATATAPNGNIALKTERCALEWSLYDSHGFDAPAILRSDEMVGFTLNPAAPATAQEALDLAWELAHPVKEGQAIPEGVRLLDRLDRNDLSAYTTRVDFIITARESLNIRTLDPLPDPEPDWLDAPAVLAAMNECSWQKVWLPKPDGHWECTCCGVIRHWSKMADVTPLYPKEDA